MYHVSHVAYQECQLVTSERPTCPANDIAGPALCSLVSPGTELAAVYCGSSFPRRSGYASVFRIEEIGKDVEADFKIGEYIFCMAGHQSWVSCDVEHAVRVPASLDPQTACLARLMGVSHTSLVTTAARAGDKVFIAGLGPVGYLAAMQFKIAGFEVFASDLDERRCAFSREAGIHIIKPGAETENLEAILAIDCSGHEAAVMQCADALRRCGELVLVGVPWKQHTDISAHAVLDKVFHKYIHLRSGWEWELPTAPGHFAQTRNIRDDFAVCLRWLDEGRIPLPEELIGLCDPHACNDVYQGHLNHSHQHLCSVFDWRLINKQQTQQESEALCNA